MWKLTCTIPFEASGLSGLNPGGRNLRDRVAVVEKMDFSSMATITDNHVRKTTAAYHLLRQNRVG